MTDINVPWLLIRGSGISAFGLLAAASIWGLLLSSKLLGNKVKTKGLTWVHEALAIGALVATGLHMTFLVGDNYLHYGARELLVPGASTYRPLAVAWGVVGFYALFLITASFYVRPLIGQTVWKAIHFLSYGTFLAAAVHGITAGADTSNPAVLSMYVGSLAIVTLLVMFHARTDEAEAAETPSSPRRPAPAVDRLRDLSTAATSTAEEGR